MKFKIILLGGLSFLIALLATIPMAFVIPFLPEKSPVKLIDVSGTVWQGQAAALHYQNIPLGQLEWEIQPLAIFMGRLRSKVLIDGDELQVDSLVDIKWDKSIQLSQTKADIKADFLQNFKQIPAKLGGSFNANMASILIKEGQFPLMEGQIKWLKGQVISPIDLALGAYSVGLSIVNNEQHGRISSDEAPLDLQGKFQLDKQGNYQTKFKIKARKDASAFLSSSINSLGKKEKDGFISLDKKGNLSSLLP